MKCITVCILYLCHIYCTCTRVTTVLKLWTRLLTVGLHSRLILYGGVTALYCYSVTVVQCKSVTTVLQGKPVGLHAQVILCCGAKGQTFVIEAHFKCPEFKFVLYGKYSMKHQTFNTFNRFSLLHRRGKVRWWNNDISKQSIKLPTCPTLNVWVEMKICTANLKSSAASTTWHHHHQDHHHDRHHHHHSPQPRHCPDDRRVWQGLKEKIVRKLLASREVNLHVATKMLHLWTFLYWTIEVNLQQLQQV